MDQNQPFLLRWSLKRKSRTSASLEQSNAQLCDQPFPDGDGFLNLKESYDQNFNDQKVTNNKSPKKTIYANMNANRIQSEKEKANFCVPTGQKSLPPLRNNESPAVVAKKMKFEEPNDINPMDVDTSSDNFISNKDLDEIFKEKLDELIALEKKFSEWLDGSWLPSKDDAVQLLTTSIILKQRFQDLCKNIPMTEEMKTASELCKELIGKIKDSISECDACSLELMDYDTCSWTVEKMSAESGGTEMGTNHQVDWTLNSGIQEIPVTEWSSNLDEENLSKNSASVNLSQEDYQPNTDVPVNIPHELDPTVRAQKVRAIRAVLLPRIIHMLDNYDEWYEEHHDDVMCEFLDTKHEEMRRQKRSVDDNRAALEKLNISARGSTTKYCNAKPNEH